MFSLYVAFLCLHYILCMMCRSRKDQMKLRQKLNWMIMRKTEAVEMKKMKLEEMRLVSSVQYSDSREYRVNLIDMQPSFASGAGQKTRQAKTQSHGSSQGRQKVSVFKKHIQGQRRPFPKLQVSQQHELLVMIKLFTAIMIPQNKTVQESKLHENGPFIVVNRPIF